MARTEIDVKRDVTEERPTWLNAIAARPGSERKVAKHLTRRAEIRAQLAARESVRAARAVDPESQARKTTAAIYPELFAPFLHARYDRGNMVQERFARLIAQGKPLEFLMFWGGGTKPKPTGVDEELIKTVDSIAQAVQFEHDPGAKITVVIADLHAKYNGYDAEDYFAQVEIQAHETGIDTVRLSSLYDQWGIELPHPDDPISPDSETAWSVWQDPENSERVGALVLQASKYNLSGSKPANAAFNYTAMRHRENPHLVETFPDAVLVVPGHKNVGMITLPKDMPHFYLPGGAPWFQQ